MFEQVFSLKILEQNEFFNPRDNIIMLTFDDNYMDQSMNLILSISKHNPVGISFVCVGPVLKQENICKLLSLKLGIQVRNYDFFLDFEMGRWPASTLLRLFSPWLLTENISKIVYMDSDMLCTGSLQPLFDMDVQCIAMCNEISGNVSPVQQKVFRPISPVRIYCNAGVTVFNLNYLRNHYSFGEIYQAYCSLHNKIAFLDQDFLNIYFNGKIEVLNAFHYNFQAYELYGTKFYKRALDNCRLIHFSVGKPWLYKSKLEFIRLYLKHSEYEPMIRRVKKTFWQSLLYSPVRFARHMLSPLKQAWLARKK